MTGDELADAIARCRFRCVECQSDRIRLDWALKLGFIPVIQHFRLPDGTWCPALGGGLAAQLASLDLLDALAAVMAVSDYGEPVWHRREVAA